MARSLWIGALVGMLACTAPGRAQVLQQERIVTVREAGKPAQKCRVLKCWTEKDGSKGCQVQNIDTREIMTIMDGGTGAAGALSGGAKPLSRIFHWGSSQTPPEGVPVAPASAIVLGTAVTSATASRLQPVASPSTPLAAPMPSKPAEHTVTIKGPDGRLQECRVLKETTERDGSKVRQIQVIATGEVMTMTESRPGAGRNTGSGMASLLHWREKEMPDETWTTVTKTSSVPPSPVGMTKLDPTPAPTPATPAAVASKPEERFVTIKEEGRPTQKCRVLKVWTQKDGSKACQIQAIDTYEILTMVETRSIPGSGQPSVTRIYPWKSIDIPPSGAPTPPVTAIVLGKPMPVPASGVERLFGPSKTASSAVVISSQPAVSTTVPAQDTGVAKTTAEPPPAKTWRQSWGKTERWSADDSNKALAQSSTRAEETIRPSLPRAQPVADDPIKQPQVYVKTLPSATTPAKPESKPAVASTVVPTATTTPPPASAAVAATVPASTPPAAMSPLPKPAIAAGSDKVVSSRPSLWSWLTGRSKTETVTVVKETPAPADESGRTPGAPKTPVGMGSVLAAGSPALTRAPQPIGRMTMVDGQPVLKPVDEAPTPGVVSVPVTAPNAFTMAVGTTQGMPGPMMMPQGPMMMPPGPMMMPQGPMMAQGVPPGMGNAFTNGSSTRPIPAEYGMLAQEQNAFEHSGMSASAARPPMMAMAPGYYPYPMPMMPTMPMPPRQVQEPQTGHLIAVLRDSILPSEREMAVEKLACYDGRSQPQIVSSLVVAAKVDPAPAVRAGCVRALAKMKMNTLPVVQTVQALRNDEDIRVRHEVEQALLILSH